MLVKQMLSMKSDNAKPWIDSATIVTIAPTTTLGEAATLLAEKRIGAVVVSTDGRRPEGILSERDIVRQLGKHGPDVLSQPVSGVMTCTTGEDALTILERMTQGRFRHMPVVDGQGDMLGVISIGDAVSGRLKELAAEKEALTGMIMGS